MAIKDASELHAGQELTYDICIIGTGAAGIAMAVVLAGQGKNVVLLESSALASTVLDARFDVALREREETTTREDDHFAQDSVVQTLYEGSLSEEMSDIDRVFLTRSRIRVYGGTTNCWGGWTRTLDPIDFNRSDLDLDYRWPIDRETLESSYRTAMQICSLGTTIPPSAYDDPSYFVGKLSTPVRPIEFASNSRVTTSAFTGIEQGFWQFQIVYRNVLENGAGITVWRNANVRRLETDAAGTVVHRARAQTIVEGRPGNEFTVAAPVFVLAMGGTEIVRLLLLSREGGLGNSSDQLGRNFMIHPLNEGAATFTTGTLPQDVRNFYVYPRPSFIRDPVRRPRVWASVVPTAETLVREGLGNFRVNVDFGPNGGRGSMNLNWEQRPNPESRITLTGERDLLGDRRVLLNWETEPKDVALIRTALAMTHEELSRVGYARGGFQIDERIAKPGDHHMGATRMSDSPAKGVVNANLRMHDVYNTYIASSSVFPTVGYSNPTLTIVALAVRLANYLLE